MLVGFVPFAQEYLYDTFPGCPTIVETQQQPLGYLVMTLFIFCFSVYCLKIVNILIY